tara:strand:- start:169 stop:282 length:114 start_codon:yes stop_codon:yes gene_type:complete
MFREQLTQSVVDQNVKEQMQRVYKTINEALAQTQKTP